MIRALCTSFAAGVALGAVIVLDWIESPVGGGLAIATAIGLGAREAAALPLTNQLLARVGGLSSTPRGRDRLRGSNTGRG